MLLEEALSGTKVASDEDITECAVASESGGDEGMVEGSSAEEPGLESTEEETTEEEELPVATPKSKQMDILIAAMNGRSKRY